MEKSHITVAMEMNHSMRVPLDRLALRCISQGIIICSLVSRELSRDAFQILLKNNLFSTGRSSLKNSRIVHAESISVDLSRSSVHIVHEVRSWWKGTRRASRKRIQCHR